MLSDKLCPDLLAGEMCPFLQIVDLGCGDGAVGDALHKRGLTNLTGADISDGMMEFAEKRGIYKSLKKADILLDLPQDRA